MGQVPNQIHGKAECLNYTKPKLFYVIILNYINIKITTASKSYF